MATYTPSSSFSSNNPTHSPTPIFKSRPPRYPQAHARATSFIGKVHKITQKGPRTLTALVVDASFHLTQGYVLCQTNLGLVHVYGVPYGQVVPQMALFVRQIGPAGTNKQFVFDGFAPALSTMGPTSGSLMYTNLQPTGAGSVLVQTSTAGGFPSVSGLASGIGYYWHFYFYLPVLPTTRVTLFQMSAVTGTNLPTLEILPSGILQMRSTENGHTLSTVSPVAPHAKHWVVIQPDVASTLLVDNVLNVVAGDCFFFNGNGVGYTVSFLSNLDGSQPAPLGTWISKIGYGTSYSGGAVVPITWGDGTSNYPTDDSQIPNFNVLSSQQTLNLYLCQDPPGSTLLFNSALGTQAGSTLTLTTNYANVLATGPY